VLALTLLNIIATVLSFRAIRDTDVSLAVPMISFTPLFNILTAAVILGELPNVPGVLGILIIVTGSYVLNTAKEQTRFLDPVREMVTNPGVFAMLIVAFLYSIAINYDKMVMVNSDITFGSGVVFLLLGSFFCGVSLIQRYLPVAVAGLPVLFRPDTGTATPPPHFNRQLLLPSLFIAAVITIEAVCINTAYSLQIVPYIISIKRMSLIIIVLYGAAVLHEKKVGRRLTGTALMVLGAVIIVIFG
jgi:drug/metabolite transporter (DMT)-like permease